MGDSGTERVREFLRCVSSTDFSRDRVGAGFVGENVTKGQAVESAFKPSTRDEGKVADMERNIRKKVVDQRRASA